LFAGALTAPTADAGLALFALRLTPKPGAPFKPGTILPCITEERKKKIGHDARVFDCEQTNSLKS
jgi:hypothetical protein